MSLGRERERLSHLAQVVGLFLAYVVTARLGLGMGAVSGFATLVWPPAGIALFALLRFGYRLWPGVFAGALVANILTGAPVLVAAGIATGNTAEAVLAVFLLRRVELDQGLGRVRDVAALLLLAAVVSTMVSATMGVGSLWAGGIVGTGKSLSSTWEAWWLGDALGILTVAPLLLVWSNHRAVMPRLPRVGEALLIFGFLAALSLVVFGDVIPSATESPFGWPYILFPGVFWAAFRFTQRGAVTATFLVSAVTIAATALRRGPFTRPTLSESLILVQVFMAVFSVTALLLAAAVSERDRARATAEGGLKASRFLAQASTALASTLELEPTLQAVAHLVVPFLGDNCVIDLVEADGSIRRVAEAAADPEKEPLLRKLRSFPPGPTRRSPVTEVLRTGKTLYIPSFDAAVLEGITAGDEYTDIVRQIAPRSSVTVPLLARGKVLGAITFGMAESGRGYSQADIALAEDLGDRAGIAIDRALLFRAAQAARAEAESALADASRNRARLEVVLRKFSAMFESAPFAICLVKMPSTLIADVNPAFVQLFGFSREEAIGKTSVELGIHHDLETRSRVAEEVQRLGFVRNMEIEVSTRSGKRLFISNNMSFIELEGEKYVLVTLQDTTERRLAERALQESERQFQTLADSIPQLAWIAEPDGSIHWFNQRWYQYTGTTREEMASEEGWGWTKVLDPAARPGVMARFKAAVESGEPWEDTLGLRREDGALRRHLSRAMPVRDTSGRIVKWFGTNTDVEDQKEAEERLSEALRLRQDFLAIAGHELKTPLAALLMHLESLQRATRSGAPPSKLDERLEKAARTGRRLDSLIDQILDVSRITAGRLQLERESLDLHVLLQEVVERFAEHARRAGSRITVRGAGPVAGVWDRLRLDQILSNLLGNAIKYGQGKPIDVELRAEGEGVVLRVIDRGIGIDTSQQRKIFERFERAVGTREFGGLGLGLWIARQIVEASGGRIEVESAPGQGSTFTVHLPRQPIEDRNALH